MEVREFLFFDTLNLEDAREYIEEHLYGTMVDVDLSQRYFQHVPYVNFLNLRIIPMLTFADYDIVMSFSLCERFSLEPEEVMKIIKRKMCLETYYCIPIKEKLNDIVRENGKLPEFIALMEEAGLIPECYVLSNKSRKYGANVLYANNMLTIVSSLIGENYYLFPISRHEVLAIGESQMKSLPSAESIMLALEATHYNLFNVMTRCFYYFDGKELSIMNQKNGGITMNELFETPWLGEDVNLKNLVKSAKVDCENEPYDSQLADWFYHLLVEDVVSEEVAAEMRYKSSHICTADLEKILKYIEEYHGDDICVAE